MISIKNLFIIENLDTENLYWKVNIWYGQKDKEKNSFWRMMQRVIKENPVTLDELNILLNSCGVNWRPFVHFVMNNIDGSIDYDQLYVMKKITDILKANKTLKWDIEDETIT